VAAEKQPGLEALTEYKNVPVRYTCLNFQQSPELRRNYFFDALKAANVLKEVTWDRDLEQNRLLLTILLNSAKPRCGCQMVKSRPSISSRRFSERFQNGELAQNACWTAQ